MHPSLRNLQRLAGAAISRSTTRTTSVSPSRILSTTAKSLSPPTRRNFSQSTRLLTTQPPPKHARNLFDLTGKVFVVTGGGRGLGLTLAEGLAEAGGTVHCLDRLPEPSPHFLEAQARAPSSGGALHYSRIDVVDVDALDATISRIAATSSRLDGLIAAAGVQLVRPALDYTLPELREMMDINYGGVFFSATSAARAMLRHDTPGTIMLIASMSGFVANKGLISPVYNSSKAAVIQLGRNLAMEWGPRGIRVNSLCPGHIVTPMVRKNFEDEPWLEEIWTRENMLGRLSRPEEFKGAALFLCSEASSFMTGATLVVDGGHTAW